MIAYNQLWNQTHWPWKKQVEQARITRAGATCVGRWNCGIRRDHEIGARVYIFRVRDHHGFVASGHILDEPFQDKHFDGSGRLSWYVPIEFDVVLHPNELLSRDRLEAKVPNNWRHVMGSGIKISGEMAVKLDYIWTQHLASVGLVSSGRNCADVGCCWKSKR